MDFMTGNDPCGLDREKSARGFDQKKWGERNRID